MAFEAKNNSQTTFEQLQNNFEKVFLDQQGDFDKYSNWWLLFDAKPLKMEKTNLKLDAKAKLYNFSRFFWVKIPTGPKNLFFGLFRNCFEAVQKLFGHYFRPQRPTFHCIFNLKGR